jgi:hypothetical protein
MPAPEIPGFYLDFRLSSFCESCRQLHKDKKIVLIDHKGKTTLITVWSPSWRKRFPVGAADRRPSRAGEKNPADFGPVRAGKGRKPFQ